MNERDKLRAEAFLRGVLSGTIIAFVIFELVHLSIRLIG